VKVAYLSAEVYPFSKVGGLADVAGSLPFLLKNKGIEIIILTPFYSKFTSLKKFKISDEINHKISFNNKIYNLRWYRINYKNSDVFLIKEENFFGRDYIYVSKNFEDDQYKRFAFFSYSSLLFLKNINFKPDIIHLNDWHTSFISIYLKENFKDEDFFKKTKILLTIHNLSYQGIYEENVLKEINLKENLKEKLHFYGKINFLKGGIIFSDFISTVSPSYAKEILTKEFGCGLEEILNKKKDRIYGILNGIDYDEWSPINDKDVFKNYDKENVEIKWENKKFLEKEVFGNESDKILIGMIARLTYQKGIDLLLESFDEFFKRDLRFILLAEGEEKYVKPLKNYEEKYKDKFRFFNEFNLKLSRKIYASCDLFLIPSRFEPCGLTQMIAARYGTPSLGFKIGGIKDSIIDFDEGGYGFLFDKYEKESFIKKLDRAISIYKNKEEWKKIMRKCMEVDFSWEKSSLEYLKLYKKIYEEL
jgi:starch synthase